MSLRIAGMRLFLIVGAMAWAFFSVPLTSAQESDPTREQLQTQISILQDEISTLKKQLAAKDEDLYSKYEEVKKKEYDYQAKLMDFNLETFQTQWIQTYTIMALVVVVVFAGVVFSAFQLWKSVGAAGVQLNSEMEMSAKNVRITSSVVGVVVLVISVAFLYIYTHEVYQLRFVDSYKPDIGAPKQ
jgi:hypothetical protein